ncbi:50S ribosomal protein L25/general stress protein Ctc [Merismopedia glauca]|uniref:Large ribosomal subunit protein bL25 n=1 Tax=Merismopedia glauca CCAP 1448/3 TaxID=1296344 RepID=A0A2T1C459_9CYAN|nr:50S ribosomal protein L25/general stress protein Ctc [Merismopedia glauca]PSB03039.1 50S ribosomal protein L25 [Merismopedia glauca CCAP 1448/3]
MQLTVECQQRVAGSKARALRRSGTIPAVLYGHKGNESVSLTIEAKAAENLLKRAAVNNTLIDLSIPELSWSGKALLREVQKHPWKNNTYHLSFFAVSAQSHVDVQIPLHFTGEAPGVKVEGGILDPIMNEMNVRCAPDSIPDGIDISVTGLGLGDSLLVKDIVLPAGVSSLDEPEQTVVKVLAPQTSGEAEA